MGLIEQISQDVVTIPAQWSLSDAYSRLSGKAFHIEPLSARVSLADFLLGGGLGWGSLKNGSFASKLYKVQTDKFTFGSNYSTSVNAGYPLHRLVEGMGHELCPFPDAKIERVTVPLRAKPQVKAVFRACALTDAQPPVPAANFVWVNDAAASALGVSGAGSVAFFEEFEPEGEGEPVEGVYEKRFFEDAVPPGYAMLKILTVKSNLPKLKELVRQSVRFFVCVWTHLGVLVCISGEAGTLADIEREACKLPLTFGLPKKGGSRSFSITGEVKLAEEAPAPEVKAPEAKTPAAPKAQEPAKPAPVVDAQKEEPQEPAVKEPEKPATPEGESKEPQDSDSPAPEKE